VGNPPLSKRERVVAVAVYGCAYAAATPGQESVRLNMLPDAEYMPADCEAWKPSSYGLIQKLPLESRLIVIWYVSVVVLVPYTFTAVRK
jgi:hypothetical protein